MWAAILTNPWARRVAVALALFIAQWSFGALKDGQGYKRPVHLGEGGLNQSEVKRLWSSGRANLERRGENHLSGPSLTFQVAL